jgi:hypothetical protein
VFTSALEQLVTDLRAAGLNASLDPADVSPPGVVVRADALLPASGKMCGDYPVRTSVILVVPATTTVAAYRALDELYTKVLAAGIPLANDERIFQRLVMPDDPTGLPALHLTALPRVTI